MKRVFILAGAIVISSLGLKAQKADSVFKKTIINKTEIEILYSHYSQDGKNSAVTGGIGTEKLTVYAPSFKTIKTINSHSVSFKAGADIISSASTDRIDFVMSSASVLDMRSYGNLGYARDFKKKRVNVRMGTGFSIESDYTSVPVNVGTTYTTKNKMRVWNFDLQTYFDDLRWGRLNENYHRPEKLIYPVELRYQDWYQSHKRNSFNLKLGVQQVINQRNLLGIYPEMTYQNGLLATPFHRVYFNDGSLKVENLPSQRIKGLLGLKLNSFITGRTILKNRIDLYADDFGIMGIALENETSFKLNPQLTLSPSFRVNFQKGSKYFAPYMEHNADEVYYTSDYDLSDMKTYKAGIGLRYLALKNLSKRLVFNDVRLLYAFYYRSNQMHAHIISVVFDGVFDGGGGGRL